MKNIGDDKILFGGPMVYFLGDHHQLLAFEIQPNQINKNFSFKFLGKKNKR